VTGATSMVEDDALLEDIRQVADELGHAPSIIEYYDHGEYGYTVAIRRFDGWIGALRAADIQPRDKQLASAGPNA